MITNLDPKAWVSYADDGASQRHDDEFSAELRDNGIMLDYLPRPEFDVGDNPILVAFVEDFAFRRDEFGDDLHATALSWIENGWPDSAVGSPEQIVLAHTVLEAIVRGS